MAIDYEKLETGMTDSQLTRLGKLAHHQMELEDRIKETQSTLDDLNKQHNEVSGVSIPSLLDETGLSEVRLADGTKVSVREDLRVSTTGKYRDVINAWLESRGLDDVIRDEVTAAFAKGAGEAAAKAVSMLKGIGAAVDRKRYVNPMTFAALLRELMADGESVPLEDLGAYVQRRTKLERNI